MYGIVKQSGGNVWVYSEPGKGATFKIYLPRETKAASAAPGTGTKTIAVQLTGIETLLVVEDDVTLRKLIQEMLGTAGYTVLAASNGMEALEASGRHPGEIHLLLTDVVMPGMNGLALAARLSKIRPHTKVLYMSGYTDNAVVHHGILEENVAFIQKPFTTDNLRRKVREVLEE